MNPRTPSGTDLESVALDQAWLPLRKRSENKLATIKIYVCPFAKKLFIIIFIGFYHSLKCVITSHRIFFTDNER